MRAWMAVSLVAVSTLAAEVRAASSPFAAWRHRREIVLDTTPAGANVTGDVPGYPLPLALNGEVFDFAKASADGRDLRFARKDGTPLPHAVEQWDPQAKAATVWVKVDVEGNDASQSFMMYWGNPKAEDVSSSAAVFDVKDGFVGVWHLGEDGSEAADGYKDATANAAHATGVRLKPGSRVPGRAGHATQFRYADNQWIKIDGEKRKLFDLTNNVTFSIWARADSYSNRGAEKSTPGYETMMAKGDNSWRLQMFGIPEWHKPPAQLLEICVEKAPKGDLCVVGKTDMATGKWYHFAGVHEHPKAKFYVNGVLEQVEAFDEPWVSGDHPVGIGNQSQWPDKAGRQWDGALDEARVLGVSKSDDWIKLDYESQREGQKLVRFSR